jgi:hypothetical protein
MLGSLASSSTFLNVGPAAEARRELWRRLDAGERFLSLRGDAGLGKSAVLDQILRDARQAGLRAACVRCPCDGESLLNGLLEGVRRRPLRGGLSRADVWRSLADQARLLRLQRIGLILAVDDDRGLDEAADRLDLERLRHLDPHPRARVSVLVAGRPREYDIGLVLRLEPLTRAEAADYLAAKLGSDFTPAAVSRLHALARGVPAQIEQIATRALDLASGQMLSQIDADLIDEATEMMASSSIHCPANFYGSRL